MSSQPPKPEDRALVPVSPDPDGLVTPAPIAARVDPPKQTPVEPGVLLAIHAQLTAEFLGPLPSPDTLQRYEQLVPGSAARILAMAEKQSNHRQSLEKNVVEGNTKKSWWGLWSGLAMGTLGITGSVLLGLFGSPTVGSILAGTTLVALVSVFVLGTSRQEKERKEKHEKINKEAAAKPPTSPPATPPT